MSSIPGYTLEKFIMWNYNLIVEGDPTANPSLQIAELLGNIQRRPDWSLEQFKPLVELFEPYRYDVERVLDYYDEEENGSWRWFAGYAFDFIPDEIYNAGSEIIRASSSALTRTEP